MCQSAYIHVPFCKDICAYCDFTRCRYHAGLADRWGSCIEKEIKEKLAAARLRTLYIGGGTPSALSLLQLERLLKAVHPYLSEVEEFTIEANPDSFTPDKIALCKKYGVNRVSLGVQTLQPKLLQSIHRQHTAEEVLKRLQQIKAGGISNISIDLIYGLPNQTMAQWIQDLSTCVTQLDVQHISLYSLTIEEHSEFGRKNIQPMEEDLEADMYEYAVAYLKEAGFEHYEISNFAKEGKRSQHNMTYWQYDDFIGIGMGASGKRQHCRYDNTKNMQTYFTKGASPEQFPLTIEQESFEMVMMSLRTKDGVNLKTFKQRYGQHLGQLYPQTISTCIQRGELIESKGFLSASEKGMMVLNEILVAMLEESEKNA